MNTQNGRTNTVFWGVAIVSLCVLILQITLTRLFSATMYYHYAFLAVSLALFGSGAGGVLVYLSGQSLDDIQVRRPLTYSASLFALTTAVALFVILACPLQPEAALSETFVRLTCVYAASALPFLCAGVAISLAVRQFAFQMNRLYLFDLCGAALGCLVLIPLLNTLGAVNTILLVAALAASAACLFAAGGRVRRVQSFAIATLAVLLGLLGYNAASRRIDVAVAKGYQETGEVIFSKWNSFSRVTVSRQLSPRTLLIEIDADAGTKITRDGSNLPPRLQRNIANSVQYLVYQLRPRARTLIIGPGGGIDVIAARLSGSCQIDAVEVNPIIARDVMLSEPFRSYSGALYEQPGVRLIVDEGRSFLRRSSERYDLIQATLVDTWAATAAGAFALTENNLYTVEAFEDYLAHLSDDGILSMTRWHMLPSDQLLRLVSLTRSAMTRSGLEDAPGRIVIIRGPWERQGRARATFLCKKTPFSVEEVRALEQFAARNAYTVLYTPLTRPDNDFTRLIEAGDPARVWDSYGRNIAPTWDNSPFFFQSLRLGRLTDAVSGAMESRKNNLGTIALFGVLLLSLGVTLLSVLGPLALVRSRLLTVGTAPKLTYLMYFGCLGAGFIIVEVALIQKCILFLGHPAYSLTVVLFSLLCACGIGSAFSGRIRDEQAHPYLKRVLIMLAGMIVIYVLIMSPLFYSLVHLGRAWRIAITVVLLAPLGFVMGMPMPTGMRILARAAPELVPWAWGVNGAMSVLGSVVALVIALLAGFNQALLVGAALYLLAVVCITRPRQSVASDAAPRAVARPELARNDP
jgi:predicted membrane-bound spermidine synthase